MDTECFVLIEDVVVFSSSAEEHARKLESVRQRFDKANLQLHPGMCAFAQPQVQNLSFVLSEEGVAASPENVKAVQNFHTPKCVKDVGGFLDLVSFYRRLAPKFAEFAKALSTLTRKDQPFTCSPSQQEVFRRMKNNLCTTPVLSFPDFSLPFILTTEASKPLGCHFVSSTQGRGRDHCLCGRQTKNAEQSYSATEAEMLALDWASKQFTCYLHDRNFVVRTDHAALTYLRSFAYENSRLLR